MPQVAPPAPVPVPDARLKPKPAAEMAEEGEREGPVLTEAAHPDDKDNDTSAVPQFAQNGD